MLNKSSVAYVLLGDVLLGTVQKYPEQLWIMHVPYFIKKHVWKNTILKLDLENKMVPQLLLLRLFSKL